MHLLPETFKIDAVNKSIEFLCKENSDLALNAVAYIFSNSEFAPEASAKAVALSDMIKHKFAGDVIEHLLDRGADPNATKQGDLHPLDLAVELSEYQSVVHLVYHGASVGNYVTEKSGEACAHTLLRLSIKLGE